MSYGDITSREKFLRFCITPKHRFDDSCPFFLCELLEWSLAAERYNALLLRSISAFGPELRDPSDFPKKKQHAWIVPYEFHCSRQWEILSGVANHGMATLVGKAFDGCILHVFWS